MGVNLKDEQQSISFKSLSLKDPNGMYKFLQSGRNRADFFSLPPSELSVFGFSKKHILLFRENFNESANVERKKASENGIDIIFMKDKFFPPLLSEIYNPPEFLYVKGDKEVLKSCKLAVVGSRKGSEYGRKTLALIIPDIVEEDITIVSGMAYGIDSMSHKAAVDCRGKTIGVNAGGLLNIYPSGNSSMIKKILTNGCIVSEFPLETSPRPYLFPIRNRIIAGMSKAILVVEAEFRSGSLITARLGLEQNRDVFSIPGKIDSSLSRGTNYLIQQGAKLITSSADILIEFGIKKKVPKKISHTDLTPFEKKILDLMSENDVHSINYFVERTGVQVSETITVLMGMVLKNLVVEEDGGFKSLL